MLKLTVARGDKVTIGDDIIIEVLSSSDKQTRLAFNAPKEVKILTIFKDIDKQFKNRKK